MARDLGKELPKIVVRADGLSLLDEGASLLHNILIHLIRNSMDHGIEIPEERLKKTAQGTIEISLKMNKLAMDLIYQDDGRGLDLLEN